MDRPSQSPDLTIIERVISTKNRTNSANLQIRALNILREAWGTIPEDYLKKLEDRGLFYESSGCVKLDIDFQGCYSCTTPFLFFSFVL